ARQFTSARLVRTGDLRLDLVEYATGDGFVFLRKRAKRLLNGLQLSAAITDELDARCLELFGRLSALEGRKCFCAELLGVQLKLLYRCHGLGGAYPTDPFLPTDPRNETRSGGSARNLAPPPRPFNESNDALCGVECRACFFGERGKRRRIMHGEIGENLPVDLDAGFAEPVHELAVAQIVQVRARVDASDPETAEVPLFVLAVAVRVFPTALHVLLRRLPQLAAAAKRSAGRLHDLLLPLETRNVRSSARHGVFPPLRLQQAPDSLGLTASGDDGAATQAALPLRRLLREDVALEGATALHLARAGEREALPCAFVRFHFRHVAISVARVTWARES